MFVWQKNMIKRVKSLENLVKSLNTAIHGGALVGRDLAIAEDNLREANMELESTRESLDRAIMAGPVFAGAAGIASVYLATLIYRNLRHG